MAPKDGLLLASSDQIETSLCAELAELRLARNISQVQLAHQAGVGVRTIKRLEAGQGITLDTFIRVLKALEISDNLAALIPDQSVRPLERVSLKGGQRRRARKKQEVNQDSSWTWND